MSESTDVRILAVTSKTNRSLLREKLSPLDHGLVCVDTVSEIAPLHRQHSFEVILLPAALPDTDWWMVWSELSTLSPQPAILVYTRHATFQLWTAVLDLGGYDVISEPFGEEEIKGAVLGAAGAYRLRCIRENPH